MIRDYCNTNPGLDSMSVVPMSDPSDEDYTNQTLVGYVVKEEDIRVAYTGTYSYFAKTEHADYSVHKPSGNISVVGLDTNLVFGGGAFSVNGATLQGNVTGVPSGGSGIIFLMSLADVSYGRTSTNYGAQTRTGTRLLLGSGPGASVSEGGGGTCNLTIGTYMSLDFSDQTAISFNDTYTVYLMYQSAVGIQVPLAKTSVSATGSANFTWDGATWQLVGDAPNPSGSFTVESSDSEDEEPQWNGNTSTPIWQ